MRLTRNILGGLVIISLATIFVAGFLSTLFKEKSVSPLRRSIVYVDASKLIKLHPEYNISSKLDLIRKGLSKESAVSIKDMPRRSHISFPKEVSSREADLLEAETMWQSIKALSSWEESQRQALKIRQLANRRARLDLAIADANMLAKQTRDAESENIQALIDYYLYGRLNAGLKLYASLTIVNKSAFISPNLRKDFLFDGPTAVTRLYSLLDSFDKSIFIPANAVENLKLAKQQKLEIDKEFFGKYNEIRSTAEQAVDEQRNSLIRRLDASLSVNEIEERKKIDNRLQAARDEVAADLSDVGGIVYPPIKPLNTQVKEVPMNLIDFKNNFGVKTDIKALPTKNKLEVNILKDVKRAIIEIGKGLGHRVVFVKTNEVPDKTEEYIKLFKSKSWQAARPIFSQKVY